MQHAVVMAGGSGTRFWPESRRRRPKQLLPITGGRPMLAETVARLDGLVPTERTWVVTNAEQLAGAREACPELPAANLLAEPAARNTAPCIGLAATVIAARDPEAVMAVLPADHLVEPTTEFQRALRAGFEAAATPGRLVTFGIPPTYPATGYGYIRSGAAMGEFEGIPAHRVDAFTEKPDAERAAAMLASGDHLWNSGIFVWRADSILGAIARHMPELAAGLERIRGALDGDDFAAVLDEVYPTLPALPVDVGVMEKADDVVVLATPFHWSDVGSWRSLYDELVEEAGGDVAVFPNGGELVTEDARGVLAYSEEPQTVAVIGLDDVVVVRTPDAILVASRERSEDVKKVVERLRAEGREDLL